MSGMYLQFPTLMQSRCLHISWLDVMEQRVSEGGGSSDPSMSLVKLMSTGPLFAEVSEVCCARQIFESDVINEENGQQ